MIIADYLIVQLYLVWSVESLIVSLSAQFVAFCVITAVQIVFLVAILLK